MHINFSTFSCFTGIYWIGVGFATDAGYEAGIQKNFGVRKISTNSSVITSPFILKGFGFGYGNHTYHISFSRHLDCLGSNPSWMDLKETINGTRGVLHCIILSSLNNRELEGWFIKGQTDRQKLVTRALLSLGW